mmetsp:Transcript_1755/g.4677  ORF Transcript_1755/g.4677 Transcript_1755/m.4677 type:complete len:81 (-) Transcript_1755:1028-1270(-)|eukprot:scaffold51401_cov36-Tisochrysis_lutea.AAC.2
MQERSLEELRVGELISYTCTMPTAHLRSITVSLAKYAGWKQGYHYPLEVTLSQNYNARQARRPATSCCCIHCAPNENAAN